MLLFYRVPFTVFLYVLGVNSLFCFYFSWRIVDLEGADFAMYIGLSLYAVFFISGLVMIGFQVKLLNLSSLAYSRRKSRIS